MHRIKAVNELSRLETMETKTYQYRASASRDGSINPDKCTKGPIRDLQSDARADASAMTSKNKTVTLLKADTTGLNAGKFFLFQIIK